MNPSADRDRKVSSTHRANLPGIAAGQNAHQDVRVNVDSDQVILFGVRRPTVPTCTFIAAVVFLAGAMTMIAQQKPDFSGEWQLNPQASVLSPAVAAAVQSGVLRIEHHEPSVMGHLTVMFDGSKPFASKFELLSDGREIAETHGERRTVSSLRWDGDALVFTWRIQGPDGEMTISFRYELQDGGRRLRAMEQLRGGGRDQDNLWVFERP